MVNLRFEGEDLRTLEAETVLEALERHGFCVPSSCRGGHCQACLAQAVGQGAGALPSRATEGLKDAWKQLGYFLPCVCVPSEDLEIARPGGIQSEAHLRRRRWLSSTVCEVVLSISESFVFRAGQFVHVLRGDALARPYSIANPPNAEETITLHVREVEGGQMSPWLCREVGLGDRIMLRGPSGTCVYAGMDLDAPLLLGGTGTGLAPVLGVLHDALGAGHRGPIRLFHGAREHTGLYFVDDLRAIALQHDNVDYTPVVLEGTVPDGGLPGSFGEVLIREAKALDLASSFGYLAGDPALVQATKKQLFLAGVPLSQLHSDPFVERPKSSERREG